MCYDLVKIKGKVTFCHHIFTLMVFQTYDFLLSLNIKYLLCFHKIVTGHQDQFIATFFLFIFECTIPLTVMFTKFSPQKSTKINLTRVFSRVLEEISSASHNVVMFEKILQSKVSYCRSETKLSKQCYLHSLFLLCVKKKILLYVSNDLNWVYFLF